MEGAGGSISSTASRRPFSGRRLPAGPSRRLPAGPSRRLPAGLRSNADRAGSCSPRCESLPPVSRPWISPARGARSVEPTGEGGGGGGAGRGGGGGEGGGGGGGGPRAPRSRSSCRHRHGAIVAEPLHVRSGAKARYPPVDVVARHSCHRTNSARYIGPARAGSPRHRNTGLDGSVDLDHLRSSAERYCSVRGTWEASASSRPERAPSEHQPRTLPRGARALTVRW